jgi:hypothetical protein
VHYDSVALGDVLRICPARVGHFENTIAWTSAKKLAVWELRRDQPTIRPSFLTGAGRPKWDMV